MRNYNPWGKGGGGAPLRDAKGNLISMFAKIMCCLLKIFFLAPVKALFQICFLVL